MTNVTQINAVKDAIKLIQEDNALDKTNKYFGMYIFFISGALPIIDVIELVVQSV